MNPPQSGEILDKKTEIPNNSENEHSTTSVADDSDTSAKDDVSDIADVTENRKKKRTKKKRDLQPVDDNVSSTYIIPKPNDSSPIRQKKTKTKKK